MNPPVHFGGNTFSKTNLSEIPGEILDISENVIRN